MAHDVQATVNGFQETGSWDDVVAAGERVEDAFWQAGSEEHPGLQQRRYKRAVEDWATWRPQADESLDSVRQRTAEMVSGNGIMGTMEEKVYKILTLRASPLFFDNRLVTAELGHKYSGDYEFEVNVHRDELRDAVGNEL